MPLMRHCCSPEITVNFLRLEVGTVKIRNLLLLLVYTIIKLHFQNISIFLKYEKVQSSKLFLLC